MVLCYFRPYSMVRSYRRFPDRVIVRHLFENPKERQEKREKILAELQKGYLFDLKEVKATGGKRYLAMSEPFQRKVCIYNTCRYLYIR